MFTANGKPIKVGQYLRLHPATDEWMRGARQVRVTSVRTAGFSGISIRHDESRTNLGFKSAKWAQENTVHVGESFD